MRHERRWRGGGRRVALIVAFAAVAPLVHWAAVAVAAAGPDRVLHEAPLTLEAESFSVHFWPGHERLAARLLEAAPELARLPALPADVLRDGEPVRIYIAPDQDRFHRLAGGRVPEWGAGVAIPSTGTIVLPVYDGHGRDRAALVRVLRHELAHLALHRYLSPARPPRWFDEGYARWAAGEWDWEAAWQLRLAFAFQRAPPLDSISLAWPAAAADARVAYLLATTTVAFLINRSGERGLELFLQRWRDGATMEDAMRRTYGLTLDQFERHWRQEVRSRYAWAMFLSHAVIFWAFSALLIVLLFARRRRYDRERLRRMRAVDPPDDPAYWLEADPTLDAGGRPVAEPGDPDRPAG